MQQLNRTATSSLITILVCALVAWLVYVLAVYVELVTTIDRYGPNVYSTEIDTPSYSKYLFFTAIAILAIGGLVARRKLLSAKATATFSTRLASSVDFFAATVIIIALAIAVFVALTNFLVSFSMGSLEQSVQSRIFDAYLPIILYTALVVLVLLFAFVFKKHGDTPETVESPLASTPMAPMPAEGSKSKAQRNIALAFTVPIVAVAFALIIGLIAYDLTRTSLEVWIWVLILTLVAVGIILGARYAAAGARSLESEGKVESGVAVGARVLGLILSIIFAASVTGMSLGYSASAVEQLRIAPSLSLSIYSDKEISQSSAHEILPLNTLNIYASGYGLSSGSTASLQLLSLDASTELPIDSVKVDSGGYAYIEGVFPADIVDGEYSLTLSATYPVDSIAQVQLPVTVEGDEARFTDGTDTYLAESKAEVADISGDWLLRNLLPSFVMLLLVLATLYLTIQIRNSSGDNLRRDLNTNPQLA